MKINLITGKRASKIFMSGILITNSLMVPVTAGASENNGDLIEITDDEARILQNDKNVNAKHSSEWRPEIYGWKIYGDNQKTVVLPTVTTSALNDEKELMDIDKIININFEDKNFSDLEKYLSENISGFNLNNFVLDTSRLFDNGSGNYFICYNYVINGYITPYYVSVVCKDGVPSQYFANIPDINVYISGLLGRADEIPANVIDTAKKEGAKHENIIKDFRIEKYTITNQTVTPKLDENGKPYLDVATYIAYDIDGDIFEAVSGYKYYLAENYLTV
ncbi:hypothetical protein IMSAG049_01258 [Clostridiales bacterium]|nr:hypothetical protein IMSAG049_01258 [Clostridiales bacterium]